MLTLSDHCHKWEKPRNCRSSETMWKHGGAGVVWVGESSRKNVRNYKKTLSQDFSPVFFLNMVYWSHNECVCANVCWCVLPVWALFLVCDKKSVYNSLQKQSSTRVPNATRKFVLVFGRWPTSRIGFLKDCPNCIQSHKQPSTTQPSWLFELQLDHSTTRTVSIVSSSKKKKSTK